MSFMMEPDFGGCFHTNALVGKHLHMRPSEEDDVRDQRRVRTHIMETCSCSHCFISAFKVSIDDTKRLMKEEKKGEECGLESMDVCEVCYLERIRRSADSLEELQQCGGEFMCVCAACGEIQKRTDHCQKCKKCLVREIDTSSVQGSFRRILRGLSAEDQSLAMRVLQSVLAEYHPKVSHGIDRGTMGTMGTMGSMDVEGRVGEGEEGNQSLFTMYRDERKGLFGCREYTRGCHIQCPDCMKFVCCRICHDRADPTHKFRRKDVDTMKCSYCGLIQHVGDKCIQCRAKMSVYYCDVCHLFDCPPPNGRIFHCEKCGECRKAGVDKKVRHCDVCGVCVFEPHECFKYSLKESTCSICGESLFSTREQSSFPPCGHWAHRTCLERHVRTMWSQQIIPACPLCRRAVVDLKKVDEIIDRSVALDHMPEELTRKRQRIVCHECGEVSVVPFHYKFRKCPNCKHYHTQLL
eukprot:TRINITY_DN1383_c0_g1_i2.p1 TRINITY_DN1383_c0_g1~~TRINITY_DN1383_c0_g1_i2.p1  ORF type:complete len:465 (-),score=89.78 TRINITY_DN1383_c0_g1_i2:127-1521(-)